LGDGVAGGLEQFGEGEGEGGVRGFGASVVQDELSKELVKVV